MRNKSAILLVFLFSIPVVLVSCVTSDEGFDREQIENNEEFEKVIKIEKIEEPVQTEVPKEVPSSKKKSLPKSAKKEIKKPAKKNVKPLAKKKQVADPKAKKTVKKPVKQKKQQRLPKIEDDEGFSGRRPLVDPYRVGEEVVLGISYFGVEAGKFTMQVLPMVQVNGRKSYHFRYLIKSSRLFSMFYSVDDVAETFVDYENLVPYTYEIHVNESKQIRETKTYFDHKNKKATMWDKKKKKGEAVENKKIEWELTEYPQNVFSAAYYLRNFTLKVGKKIKVNVGHEGKNILMTAEVVRKEKIFTNVGSFETFVVKPSFDIDGKFKPTGENFLWLTADENKFIVRLESKIKIGTIVGEVQKIKK